jgi:hypothetical protein
LATFFKGGVRSVRGIRQKQNRGLKQMSEVIIEHKTNRNTLTAKSLKVTLVLSALEVSALSAPDGQPRCVVRVNVAGRTVTADLNAKSVRKAIAAIKEYGAEGCAVILQGKLNADNTLAEAGLAVQPKTKE